jgi:PilZ domain-containing protein
VPTKPRVLEQVLDAYREGDLDECIRLVRTLVEAAPQATAPRQLLAALFASTGNGRLALAQYRRLLPQSAERGEVIRSIAFQKQIDVYERPDALAPGRWHVLQKQLRERGLPFLSEAPGSSGRPWTETQLLALPRAWFERIAGETRFEILGLEQRALDVEAGTVWEVLAGRMRWSFALPDGRASAESLAAEGDVVHVDPVLARTARVTLVPELPVEALRFEAELARDLKLALTAGLHISGTAIALTPEGRGLLPTRPRRREDFDDMPRAPLPNAGVEPLRLPPPQEEDATPVPAGSDGAGWVEFGVLSLSEPPAGDGGDASRDGATGSGGDARITLPPERERVLDLPPPEAEPVSVEARIDDEAMAEGPAEPPAVPLAEEPVGSDVPETPVPASDAPAPVDDVPDDVPAPVDDEVPASEVAPLVDPAEVYLLQPSPDPIAGSIGDQEPQVERRRHPRVSVSLASRIALLRLSGSTVAPVEGQLSDLSTSGFSIRFASQGLGASRGALVDAVVAVDLDLPGPRGGLRLAAQVRWLEVDDIRNEVRLGIEFVLMTEPDRRRIAGTLAQAALAAREQERKAA